MAWFMKVFKYDVTGTVFTTLGSMKFTVGSPESVGPTGAFSFIKKTGSTGVTGTTGITESIPVTGVTVVVPVVGVTVLIAIGLTGTGRNYIYSYPAAYYSAVA